MVDLAALHKTTQRSLSTHSSNPSDHSANSTNYTTLNSNIIRRMRDSESRWGPPLSPFARSDYGVAGYTHFLAASRWLLRTRVAGTTAASASAYNPASSAYVSSSSNTLRQDTVSPASSSTLPQGSAPGSSGAIVQPLQSPVQNSPQLDTPLGYNALLTEVVALVPHL